MSLLDNRPTNVAFEDLDWDGVSPARQRVWKAEGFLRRHADWFIVSALVVLGLAFRMLVNRGFWLDEATSVAEAKMGFGRMLSYLRTSDVHPPLYQTVLWLDIRVFGTSEFAVRLPSLIFGTAVIPVLYGTAKELFNRKTALIAALICTIAPVEIWYSQEARMYPLFMLLGTIAIWSQVRAVRSGSRAAWFTFTIASGALLWTHYFSSLQVGVQELAFLYLIFKGRGTEEGRKLRNSWLKSTIGLAMIVAPLVTFPYGQFANYGERDTTTIAANGSVASGAPLYTAISNISSAVIGYHSDHTMTMVNALWPVAMLIGLASLGRGRTRVTVLLGALIAIPMAMLFIVGLKRNDVFELRYFVTTVPALIMLMARGVTLLARRTWALAFSLVLIVAVLGGSLADEQLDGGNGRVFDFRGALGAANKQAQPGDLMLYEPFYLHPVVHYYAPNFTSFPLVAGLTSTTSQNHIYIVDSLSFAEHDQSAARVSQVVTRLEQDRTLVSHVQQNQIEIWEFK